MEKIGEFLIWFMIFLYSGVGFAGLLLLCAVISRGVQELVAWMNDSTSEYNNWFFSKLAGIFKTDIDKILIISIFVPVTLFIAFKLYFVTLAVAIGFVLAHLGRFVIRLNTKFGKHANDKKIHNYQDNEVKTYQDDGYKGSVSYDSATGETTRTW